MKGPMMCMFVRIQVFLSLSFTYSSWSLSPFIFIFHLLSTSASILSAFPSLGPLPASCLCSFLGSWVLCIALAVIPLLIACISVLRPAIISTFLFCFHPFFTPTPSHHFISFHHTHFFTSSKPEHSIQEIGKHYSLSVVQRELGELVYIIQVALIFALFLKVAIT